MNKHRIANVLAGGLICAGFIVRSVFAGDIFWRDDFNSGDLAGWKIVDLVPSQKSDWHVYEGYLVSTSNIGGENKTGSHIVAGDPNWRDYTVSSEIVSTDDDYIGILFRYQDQNNYYRFYVSGQNGQIFLDKLVNGEVRRLAFGEEPLENCKMTLTAAVHRDTLRVYINNHEKFNIIDSSHPHGKVGFMTCYNEGAYFDNIWVSEYYKPIMAYREPELEFWCGPYLQNVLGDSATIMWQTKLPANSAVEYGLKKKAEERLEINDNLKVHEVCLRNLREDSRYFYRVTSNAIKSDWYSFHTRKQGKDRFRFALCSDSQNNFIVHRKIAKEIARHQPEFIISAGDLAHGGRRADWATEFFHPMQDLLTNIPVYVSIGNHAYGSPHFTEYFSFPEKEHETYYSLTIGNAFFIFLDNSKVDFPDKSYYTDVSVNSLQYSWLVRELSSDAAQSADWLFVVAHVPCYSEYADDAFIDNLNVIHYVPLYLLYGVDAVFSGHIHAYERGESGGVHYVITGGAGGTLGQVRNRDIPEIEVSQAGHHYCIIDLEGVSLSFKQYGIDGQLRDSFKIDKASVRGPE